MLAIPFLVMSSVMTHECSFGDSSYDTCCADGDGGLMNINLTCATPGKIEQIMSLLGTPGRVHAEPKTYGNYTLTVNHDSFETVIREYTCYMGQTGYPDPAQLYTQPGFERLFGRSYYWERGEPPVTLNALIHGQPTIPWLTDPTMGMQKYQWGCAYISDLVTPRDDGSPGFSLKAMKKPGVGGYTWSTDELYTMRLHSRDQFNGGLIVVSITKSPYGAAAWPAFWMVGQDPNSWNYNVPKTPGLALTNSWPYRGEIDIIEYVNAYTMESREEGERNHITLHTNPNCYSKRTSPNGLGKIDTTQRSTTGVENTSLTDQGGSDCYYNNGFEGCGTSQKVNSTAGPHMEAHGGAIYAIEWVKGRHIKGWHWFKDEPHPDFSRGALDIDYIESFGLPDIMHEFSTTCPIENMLSDMFMIFNTAVCGDWAGNLDATRVPEDPTGISYDKKVYGGDNPDGFGYPRCEAAVREMLNSENVNEVLRERFQWDVDFVRVFT